VITKPSEKAFDSLPIAQARPARLARVCIATPDIVGPIRNGGIGTAYTALAYALARGGHHVTIVYPFGKHSETHSIEHWVSEYARRGVTFVPLLDHATTRIEGTWASRHSFKTYQWLLGTVASFDVIHFPEWMGLGYYTILAKHQGLAFHRSTLVVGTHSPHLWNAQYNCDPVNSTDLLLLDFMERECARMADIIVSPSQYLLNWCLEHKWVFPKKTFVQPYVLPEPPETASPIPRNPREIREIVFFGRLERRKGLAIFCEAVGLSSVSQRQGIHVTFLGKIAELDGVPTDEYIRIQTRQWRCPVRVISDFGRDQAVEYLSQAGRLAVIASLADNSPNTVYECLSRGITFIASKTGGIPELIHPEDQPAVCFDPIPTSLANALESAITKGIVPATPAVDFTANELAWNKWHAMAAAEVSNQLAPPPEPKTPKVSVCLIHFNRPDYLAQAIESLRRQNYPNFEVVLVDDGSTNAEAVNFLDAIESEFRDRHWRLLRKENGGPGAARNLAAAAADGEYLLFMDDDNFALPDEVATLVAIAQHTGAEIVTTPSYLFEGDGEPAETDVARAIYLFTGPALAAGIFSNVYGDTNALVRKGSFNSLGGFPECRCSEAEDWQFFARAALAGFHLECAARPLFWYRCARGRLDESRTPENQMRVANVYRERVDSWMYSVILLAQESRLRMGTSSQRSTGFNGSAAHSPPLRRWLDPIKNVRQRTRPIRYWIMRKPLPEITKKNSQKLAAAVPRAESKPSVNNWIEKFVKGKSFVDIGGLWGTVNERVSVAMRAGASSATMVDITPEGEELWRAFEKRMAEKALSGYQKKIADLLAHDAPARIGSYNLVHCSGVIYHLPEPLRMLRNLREISTERLVIGSMVVPEVIKNRAGKLDLRGGQALYVPSLNGGARAVVACHFEQLDLHVHGITPNMDVQWSVDGRPNYGYWWWLITPHLLRSMVETAGFKVVAQSEEWKGRSIALLCEVG
jgi:glycosyltransferase involved in cell wall biosynthesis